MEGAAAAIAWPWGLLVARHFSRRTAAVAQGIFLRRIDGLSSADEDGTELARDAIEFVANASIRPGSQFGFGDLINRKNPERYVSATFASSSPLRTLGLPQTCPRALAAIWPARHRSRIRARSNSANDPSICMNNPAGVTPFPWALSTTENQPNVPAGSDRPCEQRDPSRPSPFRFRDCPLPR